MRKEYYTYEKELADEYKEMVAMKEEDDMNESWSTGYSMGDIADLIDSYRRITRVVGPTNAPTLKEISTVEDYTPETREDRLFESFAKEAMGALVEAGQADFVLLKNDKLRKWWQEVVRKDLEAQVKREASERKKQLKEQALSKLSDEEKEALGLTRKK